MPNKPKIDTIENFEFIHHEQVSKCAAKYFSVNSMNVAPKTIG